MSVTNEDFLQIQGQVNQLKSENSRIKEQIDIFKKRNSMSATQFAESVKNDNVQKRVKINQLIAEKEGLVDKIKLLKIIQFLQLQNLYEASSVPDINTVPAQIRPIASDVIRLMEDVKQQISKRGFLDTQVNELSKKTKSLGRIGSQLQNQISELRERQKSELKAVEEARSKLQIVEGETAKLRDALSSISSSKCIESPENLKLIKKKYVILEDQLIEKQKSHDTIVMQLLTEIEGYNRRIEDSSSSKMVMEKKMQQKISTFQAEINKRRGIVVHSSKSAPKEDTAQLFIKSKQLIESIAKLQENVWELEERVAFSRNSMTLMAQEIVKNRIGIASDTKTNQMRSIALQIVLKIAELDREIKSSIKQK